MSGITLSFTISDSSLNRVLKFVGSDVKSEKPSETDLSKLAGVLMEIGRVYLNETSSETHLSKLVELIMEIGRVYLNETSSETDLSKLVQVLMDIKRLFLDCHKDRLKVLLNSVDDKSEKDKHLDKETTTFHDEKLDQTLSSLLKLVLDPKSHQENDSTKQTIDREVLSQLNPLMSMMMDTIKLSNQLNDKSESKICDITTSSLSSSCEDCSCDRPQCKSEQQDREIELAINSVFQN